MARTTRIAGVLAAAALAAACGGGDKVSDGAPADTPMSLGIASPAFGTGGPIPTRFTCAGAGDRPALTFSGAPRQARELALLVIDPDAGGFVHWTVYGMARTVRGIAARGLPPGAREGRTSAGRTGWTPPCPPPGSGAHRYQFELYWLREPSKLAAGADPGEVVDALRSGAGGRGELIGRFGRG